MPKSQGELFGPREGGEGVRGWTELDKVRRRYDVLDRKMNSGAFSEKEMEEFHRIRGVIDAREREAREKWLKSFGK